jgi:hypothetical protein
MVTLITQPMPMPKFKGATGAERAAARQEWLRKRNGDAPAVLESRQVLRWFDRKAHKMAKAGAKQVMKGARR